VYRDEAVPDVLKSGDHKAIARWRLKQSLGLTWRKRPDLIARRGLSPDEQKLLDEFRREEEGLE
jgi:tRNA (guanine37-N1)-methyltransferase